MSAGRESLPKTRRNSFRRCESIHLRRMPPGVTVIHDPQSGRAANCKSEEATMKNSTALRFIAAVTAATIATVAFFPTALAIRTDGVGDARPRARVDVIDGR